MAILFLDFFGSDPFKMDQTRKFGKQTSQILEFKPKGLDFQLFVTAFTEIFKAYSFHSMCSVSP